MKKIAITGEIGAGKSTVSDYLQNKGEAIIDTDQITQDLWAGNLKASEQVLNEVRAHFGDKVCLDDKVDRAQLAQIIFADEKQRWWLNNLLWPIIKKEVGMQIKKENKERIFVIVPRLFESDWADEFVEIWWINAKQNLRKKRLANRGWSEEEIQKRMTVPFGESTHLNIKVINNNGSLANLQEQIDVLLAG